MAHVSVWGESVSRTASLWSLPKLHADPLLPFEPLSLKQVDPKPLQTFFSQESEQARTGEQSTDQNFVVPACLSLSKVTVLLF